MGLLGYLSLLNPFRRSAQNKTIATLTKLTNSIQDYERKRKEVKKFEKLIIYRSLYTTVSLMITYALIAYNNKFLSSLLRLRELQIFENYYLNLAALWLPLVILPIFYLLFRTCLKKFYSWRMKRWDRKIKALRDKKITILDNVMETETFNNAKEIFEKFDTSRLRSNFGSAAYSRSSKTTHSTSFAAGSSSSNNKENNKSYSSGAGSKYVFNKTIDHFESRTGGKPQTLRHRGGPDISSMLPNSVNRRNQTASQYSPYSNRRMEEVERQARERKLKNQSAKEAALRSIESSPGSPKKEETASPDPKPGFFSRFNPLRRTAKPAPTSSASSTAVIARSQSVKSSSSHSFLPMVNQSRSSLGPSEQEYDEDFDIGPAVPKIDVDQLISLTQKAGISHGKVKEKKVKEVKKKREKKRSRSRSRSKSKSREGEEVSRRSRKGSKEIDVDGQEVVEAEVGKDNDEIAKLKAEIERLKASEMKKISVKGRIEKSISDRTKSSNADIIKKNRKELIRKKRLEERNASNLIEPSTNPSSMENLTAEDLSTRSSLDSASHHKTSLARDDSQATEFSLTSKGMLDSITVAALPGSEDEEAEPEIGKVDVHLSNLRRLSSSVKSLANSANSSNDLEGAGSTQDTMKNSVVTVRENGSSNNRSTEAEEQLGADVEVNDVIEILDDTISLDENHTQPNTTLVQEKLVSDGDSDAAQNSLAESVDLEDGASHTSQENKLVTSDNSDDEGPASKVSDDEGDNDTGNGSSNSKDSQRDSSRDTL